MVAILSLLVILIVSLIVVRVATVALTLTGLSNELARFQARSAFTGAGFTTTESENVVHHPVRRRIIMLLMLLGNAGLVTVISSLMLSFVNVREAGGLTGAFWFRMLVLAAGLALLWLIASSRWVDHRMSRLIGWALARWTDIEARDYAGLLRLAGDYVVVEMQVQEGDWLAGHSLGELELSDEGVLVLGIERADGTYVGAPRGETRSFANDTLILYGRQDVLADLDERRAGSAGNREHKQIVAEQAQQQTGEQEA